MPAGASENTKAGTPKDDLPPPVQRYFRAVLTDGQPIIAAATIEMAGTINMSVSAEQWKPFTSHQRVVTSVSGLRPAFCGMRKWTCCRACRRAWKTATSQARAS